ncbi:unnamed protein product, partial [Brassica rapa subsp. trilocularis]
KPPHPSTTDSSSTPRTPSSPDLKIPNFNRPRSRSPPRRTNHQPQSSKSPQSCRRPRVGNASGPAGGATGAAVGETRGAARGCGGGALWDD